MQTPFATSRQWTFGLVGSITLVTALIPLSGSAHDHRNSDPRLVGQYFLTDSTINMAGGALLYSDCSHTGGLVASIPLDALGVGTYTVVRFQPEEWVNDPDPDLLPYSAWPVPDALSEVPRLFTCYTVQYITGYDLRAWAAPFPKPAILESLTDGAEFCDWIPRDLKRPLEIDITGDFVPDLLVNANYQGNPHLCADDWAH